jgi:hypothetical protein
MKKTITVLAAIAAFSAAPAMAGSVSDAKIEAPIIVAETTTSSSSGTAIVALLGILMSIPFIVD